MRRPTRPSNESPRGARPRPGSRPDMGKGKGKRGPASGSKEYVVREDRGRPDRRGADKPAHFDGRKKRPDTRGGARSETDRFEDKPRIHKSMGDSRPEKRGRKTFDPSTRGSRTEGRSDDRGRGGFEARSSEGRSGGKAGGFGARGKAGGFEARGKAGGFEARGKAGFEARGGKRFEGTHPDAPRPAGRAGAPKTRGKSFEVSRPEKRAASPKKAPRPKDAPRADLSWLESGPGPSKHGTARPTKRGGGRVGKRSDKHDAHAADRAPRPVGPRPSAGKPATGRSGPRPAGARPDTGTTSPRVPLRFGKPLVGPWLWLTRAGAETDLLSELRIGLGEGAGATEIAPGLVRSELAQTFEDGSIDATFARHGLRLRATVPLDADRVTTEVLKLTKAGPIAFDVIIPDSDEGNRLAARAIALGDEVKKRLLATEGVVLVPRNEAREHDARVVDVVLSSYTEAIVGEIEASLALTLHPQGRARMKVASDRPSRAARKVEEALDWMGLGPGAGETCVDLGAAPGGWSWSLLERRARVIAVDPAELRPDVANHPKLTHIKASAFQYGPDEPVDWLFCDMAWRPREAAQMLAKWARKGWARILVANLKLPMKSKAEMTRELREIVHGGGWKRVRSRQLYHDRDEITLIAFT